MSALLILHPNHQPPSLILTGAAGKKKTGIHSSNKKKAGMLDLLA
jgi:hypothetical protein